MSYDPQPNFAAADRARQEGRAEGLRWGERERRDWGWFCFLCGIAVSALFYGLVLS